MDHIANGWFSEVNEFWPGQALSLELDGPVLYHERSEYQDIMVFKSKAFGIVLTLDNAIQLTEKDEAAYQESITHIPVFSHPNPKKVLVIGGGDGGVLRELAKHESIEEIHLCEIDAKVIEVSKRFLPGLAVGFEDPRVHVHIANGADFVKNYHNEFDVVITDSSDPSGPASQLFLKEYFESVKRALTDDGVLITQAECIWLHLELIVTMKRYIGAVFDSVTYVSCQIPTYPSGSLGFFLARKNGRPIPTAPVRAVSQDFQNKLNYYTPDIHRSSFVLPAFVLRAIAD